MQQIGSDTLMIFPCCAEKRPGGVYIENNSRPLQQWLPNASYQQLLTARAQLLNELLTDHKYVSGKYTKNKSLHFGPDFGRDDQQGLYITSIDRYNGTFYKTANKEIKSAITSTTQPHLLILSALYGLLHPADPIQDYNLQMGDKPAKTIWNKYLSAILKDYIKANNIHKVYLYLGSSTSYFKLAQHTLIPLVKDGTLSEANLYEVQNGSTYYTPHTHGLLLASHLTGQPVVLPKLVVIRPII